MDQRDPSADNDDNFWDGRCQCAHRDHWDSGKDEHSYGAAWGGSFRVIRQSGGLKHVCPTCSDLHANEEDWLQQ